MINYTQENLLCNNFNIKFCAAAWKSSLIKVIAQSYMGIHHHKAWTLSNKVNYLWFMPVESTAKQQTKPFNLKEGDVYVVFTKLDETQR